MIFGSVIDGYGIPHIMTDVAVPLLKSIPSASLPLQTPTKTAYPQFLIASKNYL